MKNKKLYELSINECFRREPYADSGIIEEMYFTESVGYSLAYSYYRVTQNNETLPYDRWLQNYSGLCDVITSAEVRKLLSFYIFPNAGKETIVVSENGNVVANADVKERIIKIAGWFVRVYPYYKKILDIYATEEEKLMQPIKNKSKTGFSDMPQTAKFNNAPVEDVLSNLTETETESEIASKMARINEIRDGYENIYNEWTNEFIKTFVLF